MTSERRARSERECFVYVVPPGATEFVTAGRFQVSSHRDGQPVGRFVYGQRYLEREDAVELDPVELRLRRGPFETASLEGFFGAIRDSMPDHWGRRVIERAAGQPVLDELDYLMLGPDDRSGALGFGPDLEPSVSEHRFNRTLDLGRLQQAADRIMKGGVPGEGPSARRAEELLLLGTSMGGARPKAVVEHDGELWLAKLSKPTDRWNHPRVERGMLALAAACGLTVADSKIVTVAGRDVLLVRRFDRERAGDGYLRARMVSALTLLRCDDSPLSRQSWSYLLLADEIRRASAKPEEDLRELFGRMCFNAAISNLDDHPRNHAIVALGRTWRLSPAYDLTPSRAVSLDRRDLAMVCGHHGRFANRRNLLSARGRFFLSESDATMVLDRIVGTVESQWRSSMEEAGVSKPDCETISGAFLYSGFFYDGASQ